MQFEIIEAINQYYEDGKTEDDEIGMIDCLVWLKNNTSNIKLRYMCEDEIAKKSRCPICGAKYVFEDYEEYRGEVGSWERMTAKYCPNCDSEQ